MDRPETGTVPRSHILVHALHSCSTGKFTVLLVHVVGTRTRVVTQPDAEVLNLQRLLLVDLRDRKGQREQ